MRENAGNVLSGHPAVAAGPWHTPIQNPEAPLIFSLMILNAGWSIAKNPLRTINDLRLSSISR
jgi:hypothetical protein